MDEHLGERRGEKRKRGRDRPKAAHDVSFNSGKRMLLTYASDKGPPDDLHNDADTNPSQKSPSLATGRREDADDDQDVVEHPNPPAAGERGFRREPAAVSDAPDANQSVPTESGSLWSRGSRRNDVTGQWPALGSLSYQWEDDDEDSEAEDEYGDVDDAEALSYLRAVRAERQNMPTVLTVPKTYSREEIYNNGFGDTRGYFEDGAYVASANLGPHLPATEKVYVEPQEAFTNALRSRFLQQRELMHLPVHPAALAVLDEKHPTSLVSKSNTVTAKWLRLVRKTTPLLAQIRSMDQNSVLKLLELIQKHYIAQETDITGNVSAWIWSLLARLDDVGTMNNDEVWLIRELGKKAILAQLSFANPAGAELLANIAAHGGAEPAALDQAEVAATGDDTTPLTDSDDDLVDPSQQNTSTPLQAAAKLTDRQNTLATLDSIIVIVGDVFRQRDLLDARPQWSEIDQTTEQQT